MYSPTQGRFITRDPIGFDAGDPNFYRFEGNNPPNRLDPSGLQDIKHLDPNVVFDGITLEMPDLTDLKPHWTEMERGCVGLCNIRLGTPYMDFPEKFSQKCFTNLGDAMNFLILQADPAKCPAGKKPRMFAKVFTEMTDVEMKLFKQGSWKPEKNDPEHLHPPLFGKGPFDYLTLHMPGSDSRNWKWESMNWSRSYAEGLKLKWSVIEKPYSYMRQDNFKKYYQGENFNHIMYCVVYVNNKQPGSPPSPFKVK